MDITIKIDDKRIRELISEAGSGYWASDFKSVFRRRSALYNRMIFARARVFAGCMPSAVGWFPPY